MLPFNSIELSFCFLPGVLPRLLMLIFAPLFSCDFCNCSIHNNYFLSFLGTLPQHTFTNTFVSILKRAEQLKLFKIEQSDSSNPFWLKTAWPKPKYVSHAIHFNASLCWCYSSNFGFLSGIFMAILSYIWYDLHAFLVCHCFSSLSI